MLLFFLPPFSSAGFLRSARRVALQLQVSRPAAEGHAQRAGTPQYTEFHAQTDGSATHPFAARERREPSPPRSAPAGRCRARSPRACAAAQPLAPQITLPRPCVHSWLCGATTTPHYPRSAPPCQSLRLSTSSAFFNGTSRRLCLPLAARQAISRRRTQPGCQASPLGRIASPKPASSRVMALCGVQLED